jgi:hypothetical protein
VIDLQVDNFNDEIKSGLSFAKYIPMTVSYLIQSVVATVEDGYVNLGLNLNA